MNRPVVDTDTLSAAEIARSRVLTEAVEPEEHASTSSDAHHPAAADALPMSALPMAGNGAAAFSALDGFEVLAEVAHDLRSPLTSILTLAETLRRGTSGQVNDIQRRQLGLIYSAALALSATASDVIEFAHGGETLAEKEPTSFSIAEILESVIDIVQPMAQEKRIDVRTVSQVPDRRLGHPLALSRVLLNLTTNALKFTEQGYVEITVRPLGTSDSRVVFSVRDTGRGISFENLSTLYQPFQPRPSGEGTRFSGTGLGLSICKKLVRALGSTLELETRPNWGTRFYFGMDLPLLDEQG